MYFYSQKKNKMEYIPKNNHSLQVHGEYSAETLCLKEDGNKNTSLSVSAGAITIEAACICPIFILCVAALCHFFVIISSWMDMENELEKAVAFKESAILVAEFDLSGFEEDSDADPGIIDECISRNINIPIFSTSYRVCVGNRIYTRAWIGESIIDKGETTENESEQTVYITEKGSVYHIKESCTYLNPVVTSVCYSDVDSLRNSSGGKYYPCELCCKNKTININSLIYITSYGERYHSDRGCRGIEKNYKAVKLSEVTGRRKCSKCGKEE